MRLRRAFITPIMMSSCIALVERGLVKLAPLVSDVMPLGELKAAIGLLASDSGQRMKIIMEHS